LSIEEISLYYTRNLPVFGRNRVLKFFFLQVSNSFF
jgi:hypothetical protein